MSEINTFLFQCKKPFFFLSFKLFFLFLLFYESFYVSILWRSPSTFLLFRNLKSHWLWLWVIVQFPNSAHTSFFCILKITTHTISFILSLKILTSKHISFHVSCIILAGLSEGYSPWITSLAVVSLPTLSISEWRMCRIKIWAQRWQHVWLPLAMMILITSSLV